MEDEPIYDTVDENVYESRIESDKAEAEPVEEEDYLHHYQDYEEVVPEPEVPKHTYDFELDSSAANSDVNEEKESEPPRPPLSTMAELVDDGTTKDKENEIQTINKKGEKADKLIFLFIKLTNNDEIDSDSYANAEPPEVEASARPMPRISLFTKAGSDRECIGCCPFSQRLFMLLWLKGVVFNVTTVDKATKPKQLSDIAPGTNPPFLIFNGEELTDFQKCEDYIEAELYPPRYPKLACKHQQSNTVGNDIFAKFSAFIKFNGNKNDPKRKMLETKLNDALKKFDRYLNEPLDDEIDADDDSDVAQVSKRKFIDGDNMTIADCNMLPKLNMIRVAGREMLKYEIPEEYTGIARYLRAADETEEFVQTCPDPGEIVWTYGGRKPKPKSKN